MKAIVVEMEKDIQLLKTIAKVGFITEKFLPLIGMSNARLRQHILSGNINKKGTYLVYGKAINIYNLSQKSKRRMQSEFAINLYKSDVSQIEHDYVLLKIYMSLSLLEKESWITESKLQVEYPSSRKTTDALFIKNGKKIGVEVITDSYSKIEVKAKMDFIRYYCDDYIMMHTHRNILYSV